MRALAAVDRRPRCGRYLLFFEFAAQVCVTGCGKPGAPTQSHCRKKLRKRQKVPHRPSFTSPLVWVVGPGTIRPEPMPHNGSSGLDSARKLMLELKR